MAKGIHDVPFGQLLQTAPCPELSDGDACFVRAWDGRYPVACGWATRRHDYAAIDARAQTAVRTRALSTALLTTGVEGGSFSEFVQTRQTADDPVVAEVALPPLTIAVCTRDRPEDLARCLNALSQTAYAGPLECIVVDNASSSDETHRVCAEHSRVVRFVREERPGLNWARNRALAEAMGSLIAFTDDDAVVHADWPSRIAAPFLLDAQVEAVTGLVMPFELETDAQRVFERLGGFGRGFHRRWIRPAGGAPIALRHGRSGQFGTGANMAFRTATLRRIGGFDPALDAGTITEGAGDLEMFFRVLKSGGALVYEPRAVVSHRHRRTMEALDAQIRSWGSGVVSYFIGSAARWPEERAGFVLQGLWMIQHWISQGLLSATGLSPVPTRLILREAGTAFRSIGTYAESARRAREIAGGALPDLRGAARTRAARPRATSALVRQVALDGPVPPVEVDHRIATVRLVGTWKGRPVCRATIDAQGQSIPAAQVADALATAAVRALSRDVERTAPPPRRAP